MNEPKVINITYDGKRGAYFVDQYNWNGGDVVSVVEMATYIERNCGFPIPIIVGETKHDYGLRMLKALAHEVRNLRTAQFNNQR